MVLEKISSIFFHIVYFLVFYNIHSTLTIFRLQDVQINQYYLGTSRIYSLENNSKVQKREISKNELIFSLKLNRDVEPFEALIKKRKSDVIFENTKISYIQNEQTRNESNNEYYITDSYLYEGYILQNPYNSSINGYIKDNCFYGHVIVNDTFYYVDFLNDSFENDIIKDDQQKRNAVIYTRHSVIFTGVNDVLGPNMLFPVLTQKDFYRVFQSWKEKGMLCTLVIVIDYSFLTQIHRGNTEAATFQVLFSLEEVNSIFRSTDFDGDGIPDNIGFYVKKIVIVSSPEKLYFTSTYTKKLMDVNEYITRFRRFHELQNHCLGIIFTAQKFKLKTLGASFSADNKKFLGLGGICEMFVVGRGSFNALVITTMTEIYSPVPQIIFEITITHELGHSFGASHDEANNPECFGHIMSPKTFKDYKKNDTRMLFSSCSKEQILRTLTVKGKCFEPVETSFCGNGIVEDDEQCDCGLTRECLKKDPCCVPRRTTEHPCRVNKKLGFECHPSQGECCTEKCKYNTYLSQYVNCQNFDRICPCQEGKKKCGCGINGICIQSKCHSIECTRLNLTECECKQDKLQGMCSVCCEYKNQCMIVSDATDNVIKEGKDEKLLGLFSKIDRLIYQGKNWIPRKFCLRKTELNYCQNLHFFQGKPGANCLLHGKLGKCNQSFSCNIVPSKRSFPSLESNSGKLLGQLGLVRVVTYFYFQKYFF